MVKIQFSITMETSAKERAEALASAQGISLAAYLEMLAVRDANAVDAKTWEMIYEVQKRLAKRGGKKALKKSNGLEIMFLLEKVGEALARG